MCDTYMEQGNAASTTAAMMYLRLSKTLRPMPLSIFGTRDCGGVWFALLSSLKPKQVSCCSADLCFVIDCVWNAAESSRRCFLSRYETHFCKAGSLLLFFLCLARRCGSCRGACHTCGSNGARCRGDRTGGLTSALAPHNKLPGFDVWNVSRRAARQGRESFDPMWCRV